MVTDLTAGSVGKLLLRFAFPLFISNALQAVYNMVDMIVVGQFIGGSGMSAVSIGGDVLHFITFHGLALNVNTDLKYFSYINPCGFVDKQVCSISSLTHNNIDMDTVKKQFTEEFTQIFIPKYCCPVKIF